MKLKSDNDPLTKNPKIIALAFIISMLTFCFTLIFFFLLFFMKSSRESNISFLSSDGTNIIAVDNSQKKPITARIKVQSTPQPVVIASNYSQAQIIQMIHSVFGANGPRMVTIAKYESSMNPNATGYYIYQGQRFRGLYQIYDGTWRGLGCKGNPYDAYDNIVCAKKVLQTQGFGAWEVVTKLGV